MTRKYPESPGGAALSRVIAIPDVALGWLLAAFAGVIIAIGVTHFLPVAARPTSDGLRRRSNDSARGRA
jgi:zinc transporter ZupT